MGEIAEAMLTGELCAQCGVALECDECTEDGIPKYCSKTCAVEGGGARSQVCEHNGNEALG